MVIYYIEDRMLRMNDSETKTLWNRVRQTERSFESNSNY